jgi:glycosyltransferase involved in cell wall biosynthesis
MRVLHFLWAGGIGGAERAVHQLVRRQLADTAEVGVFFAVAEGPYLGRFRALGCDVLIGGLRGAADLGALPRVARLIRPYDVHHFHLMEPAAMMASALSGKKARVYTERGGTPEAPGIRKRLRFRIARPLARQLVHGYSGNTAHAARTFAARYGISEARVHLTPNSLDPDLLAPRRPSRDVRAELGIDEAAVVVGTSAHLKPWKRIELLLDTVPGVAAAPEVLVLGDGPERQALEERAALLGLAARTRFTGMKDNVADYLAAMDVFVLPSTGRESFGNAVVEAMALGVPSVVMRDSPGICEHIRDGETGFVASGPKELRAVLELLVRDASLRRSIGSAGAEFVRRTYTPERMAASYERLYADAAAFARLSGRRR